MIYFGERPFTNHMCVKRDSFKISELEGFTIYIFGNLWVVLPRDCRTSVYRNRICDYSYKLTNHREATLQSGTWRISYLIIRKYLFLYLTRRLGNVRCHIIFRSHSSAFITRMSSKWGKRIKFQRFKFSFEKIYCVEKRSPENQTNEGTFRCFFDFWKNLPRSATMQYYRPNYCSLVANFVTLL